MVETDFWEALDLLRMEIKMSKKELARRAGVDVAVTRTDRRKNRALNFRTVAKLGNALMAMGISRRQYVALVDTLAQMRD